MVERNTVEQLGRVNTDLSSPHFALINIILCRLGEI